MSPTCLVPCGCFSPQYVQPGYFCTFDFTETTTKSPTPHIGRKIARAPTLKHQRQREALAQELGISQQAVSRMEQSEKLEDERLEEVAKVLGVPAKAIENFNEEAAVNFIANTFTDGAPGYAYNNNYQCQFNPIEKVVELYDALLKEKDEKIALMERILGTPGLGTPGSVGGK